MLCLCTFTYFKLHTSFKLLWCQLNWSQIKFAKLRLAVFLKLGECKIVQTRVRTSCLISRNSISFLFIINVISNTIYPLLKNITHRSSYVPTAPENIRLRSVYFLMWCVQDHRLSLVCSSMLSSSAAAMVKAVVNLKEAECME